MSPRDIAAMNSQKCLVVSLKIPTMWVIVEIFFKSHPHSIPRTRVAYHVPTPHMMANNITITMVRVG